MAEPMQETKRIYCQVDWQAAGEVDRMGNSLGIRKEPTDFFDLDNRVRVRIKSVRLEVSVEREGNTVRCVYRAVGVEADVNAMSAIDMASNITSEVTVDG